MILLMQEKMLLLIYNILKQLLKEDLWIKIYKYMFYLFDKKIN